MVNQLCDVKLKDKLSCVDEFDNNTHGHCAVV